MRRTEEEEDGKGLRRKNTQEDCSRTEEEKEKENDWGEED